MNMHSKDLDLTNITCERFNLFFFKKNIIYFLFFHILCDLYDTKICRSFNYGYRDML